MRVLGTRVTVRPGAVAWPAAVAVGAAAVAHHRNPGRGWPWASSRGLLACLVMLGADVGHVLGHVVSARGAGAPMDELRFAAGMPRTLYRADDVSPTAHRLRAVGGPLASAMGMVLNAAASRAVRPGSGPRELTTWSAAANALLLGASLLPLPIVDGGVLLKWTLVARGRTEREADDAVRRAGLAAAVATAAVGAGLAATGRRAEGIVGIASGALGAAVAAGWVR